MSEFQNFLKEKQLDRLTHGNSEFMDFLAHSGLIPNSSLTHYGVLGMRWGVRKNDRGRKVGSPTAGTDKARHKKNRRARKATTSTTQSKPNQSKNKKTKDLSNAELRQMIERIKLDKEYTQLTAKQKSVVSKMLGDILVKSTTKAATTIVTDQMTRHGAKGVEALIKKLTTATAKVAKEVVK